MGFVKFVLGVLLAIALLIGGSVAASLYVVAEMTALPPKPKFDPPEPEPEPEPAASPSPSPQPEASPSPEPEALPEGAYRARIVWPEGLIVRDTPSFDAGRVGGAGFESEVIVLETNEDGSWEKVRLGDGTEGWVVGGNSEAIE